MKLRACRGPSTPATLQCAAWSQRWHSLGRVLRAVRHTFMEESIGVKAIDDILWDVYFSDRRLDRFGERLRRIIDDRGRLFRHFEV